jgi:hypothetical protein
MLTDYEQLRRAFTDAWGIPVNIETKTEAQRAAVQYNTHYMGRNFEDMGYKRETLFDIVGCKLPDAHNDHKKPGAAAAAAAAASSQQVPADAAASSSSGAAAAAAAAAAAQPSSSSSGGRKKKKDAQQQQQQQQRMPPLVQQQRQFPLGIRMEETDDGFTLIMPGTGAQQHEPAQEITCTMSQHVRQRNGLQGWVQVLGAVSTGRVTQQQVQQLSDMVKAL